MEWPKRVNGNMVSCRAFKCFSQGLACFADCRSWVRMLGGVLCWCRMLATAVPSLEGCLRFYPANKQRSTDGDSCSKNEEAACACDKKRLAHPSSSCSVLLPHRLRNQISQCGSIPALAAWFVKNAQYQIARKPLLQCQCHCARMEQMPFVPSKVQCGNIML